MVMLSLQQAATLALLNPFQRQFLEDSVASNRRALRHQTDVVGVTADAEPIWGRAAAEEDGDVGPDMNAIAESLKRDEGMLTKYSPLNYPLKPYESKKTWDEVKYLTELIQEGMPSDAQMDQATAQNIDLHLRWTERNVNGKHPKHPGINLVQARATRIRMLDPNSDDPNLTSIERIRPHQDAQVNWRAYYAGYDEIQHGLEETVEARLEELDEDRFLRFCQYKANNWTTKGIMRELGFDTDLYDAAMARLRDIREALVEDEQGDDEDVGHMRDEEASDERPDVALPVPLPPVATTKQAKIPEHAAIGAQIKQKGWTYIAVGKAIGLPHPTTLSNYCGGHRSLKPLYMGRLRKVMALDALPIPPAATKGD